MDDDDTLQHTDASRQLENFVLEESDMALTTCIPARDNGFVLITSRNLESAQSLGCNSVNVVKVKPMKKSNAMTLFRSKHQVEIGSDHVADKLIQMLDYIPLAIT